MKVVSQFREDFAEIFSTELMSITGGLLAGILLAMYTNQIILVPGLFILFPGFLEMRNAISGSLSARLSSALHLGELKPKFSNSPILRHNLIAVSILVVLVSVALGLIAYFSTWLIFGISNLSVVWVAILAGVLSNFVEIPLTIFSVFILFDQGYDPNNVMGPYITTIGDIVSVVSLLAAIVIVV